MKKILLSILFVSFLGINTYAQGVSFGIKAGLNIANQKFSNNGLSVTPTAIVGIHGGAYLTIMFSEHLGLQPELLYSAQGSKYSFSGSTVTTKINYITLPILLRYNVNDLISFHAGPQLGVVASAKSVSGSNSTDVKNQLKSTDLGLAFGGTIDLPIKLNITLRYILGLSNIDNTGSSGTYKNNTIQISLGYKLFGK